MNIQNLLAGAASIIIVGTSTGLFHHSASRTWAAPTEINGSRVVNLAPVNVYSQAAALRTASLLPARLAYTGRFSTDDVYGKTAHNVAQFSLVGSPLAMPYYSFSHASGRISKE